MATQTGKFVWYEYMGDDLRASVSFYTKVVGWTAKDAGMSSFPYELLSVGDTMVAGMMAIPPDAKAMGVRPSWIGYIWVEDVDAAARKLTEKGGRVYREPSDIPGIGRFAVVADPYGGSFALYRDQGGNPPPPPPPATPGLVGWHELHADDGAKALAFYCDFFGWKKEREFDMGPMGVYYLFDTGNGEHGGIMTRRPETPMSFWLYYFNADGADAAAERVKANGGRVINGPHEVPGGQWIVQALDPQGGMFALVAPKK
jgi:predicted enzyme related to lactoylglutathione lyase